MKSKIIFTGIISLFSAATMLAQTSEIINNIKTKYCPDKRTAIYEITEKKLNSNQIELSGKTSCKEAKNALIAEYKNKGKKVVDNIAILPADDTEKPWAFTIIPYAHLRTKPGHEQELTSQSLMGNPLRILEKEDDWYRVQTPDNYIAWIIGNSIKPMSNEDFKKWQESPRYIVTDIYTYMREQPTEDADIVSDLVLGNILVGEKANDDYVKVSTPDGRIGYISASSVKELGDWANQEFDAQKVINTAKALMGSTYTWGGTSTKGVDCSGLTKTSYFANGIILQRDASQQVLYGGKIKPEEWRKAEPGDLLYFGTKSGKVTHTAIYMKDSKYIHASGRVKVNSVDPDNKAYLTTPFLSINRINGYVDTNGIKSVKNHPWYFSK